MDDLLSPSDSDTASPPQQRPWPQLAEVQPELGVVPPRHAVAIGQRRVRGGGVGAVLNAVPGPIDAGHTRHCQPPRHPVNAVCCWDVMCGAGSLLPQWGFCFPNGMKLSELEDLNYFGNSDSD